MNSNETIELAAARFVAGLENNLPTDESGLIVNKIIKEAFKQGAIWQQDGLGLVETAGTLKRRPEEIPRHMQFEPNDMIDSDPYKA